MQLFQQEQICLLVSLNLATPTFKTWNTRHFLVAICIGIWNPLTNTKQLTIYNMSLRFKYLTKFLCKTTRWSIKVVCIFSDYCDMPTHLGWFSWSLVMGRYNGKATMRLPNSCVGILYGEFQECCYWPSLFGFHLRRIKKSTSKIYCKQWVTTENGNLPH